MIKKKQNKNIKDKDVFVEDIQNLKKIKNKSLKLLCKLIKDMEDASFILSTRGIALDESLNVVQKLISNIKRRDDPDTAKMEKKLKINVNYCSKKLASDYLYTLKYIKACQGRADRLIIKSLHRK